LEGCGYYSRNDFKRNMGRGLNQKHGFQKHKHHNHTNQTPSKQNSTQTTDYPPATLPARPVRSRVALTAARALVSGLGLPRARSAATPTPIANR
jgi:hypothetical protein